MDFRMRATTAGKSVGFAMCPGGCPGVSRVDREWPVDVPARHRPGQLLSWPWRYADNVDMVVTASGCDAGSGAGGSRGGSRWTRAAAESVAAGEPVLAPGLEHDHGHGVGQVEAAVARAHRQAQALGFGDRPEYVLGQAAGLAAEQEGVAVGIGRLVV